MGLGMEVTKGILDMKSAEAVLQMRSALNRTESIAKWLAAHSASEDGDPLVTEFGYSSDEAYILRSYFENVDAIRTNNTNLIALGYKMTGLE